MADVLCLWWRDFLPLVEMFFGFGGDVFHFEKCSSSVLGTSPVSDTPLEVGLKIIT